MRNYRFFRYKSDAEFDLDKKDKPHLRVRIYRNNISVAEQDIYLMSTDAVSYAIEVKGQETNFRVLYGEITSRESACYHFEDDTDYEIEISNLIPFPEYEGIQSFFRIKTGQRYQPNIQEEKHREDRKYAVNIFLAIVLLLKSNLSEVRVIEFVKKHKICSILMLLILSFLVYIKFFFVLKLPLGRFGPPIIIRKKICDCIFKHMGTL